MRDTKYYIECKFPTFSKNLYIYICYFCYVQDGSIRCERKRVLCAAVSCADPVIDPGTCCPRCPADTCVVDGRRYSVGQLVPASRDPCEECRCTGGLIDCAPATCPPITCRHPGRDSCCPTCQRKNQNTTYVSNSLFWEFQLYICPN